MQRFIGLLCVLIFSVYFIAACASEDRTHWGHAREIGDQVSELLIKRGICKNKNFPCAGFIWSIDDLKNGFRFETVGIKDQVLIQKIDTIIQKKFNENIQIGQILYTAYEGDELPPDSSDVPNTKVILFKHLHKR